MPEGPKLLTRRHLLALAGGAAGVAVAGKAVAGTWSRLPASPRNGRPRPAGAPPSQAAADKLTATRSSVGPPAPAETASASRVPAAAPNAVSRVADFGLERHFTVKKADPSPRGPVMRPLEVPPASEAVAELFGDVGAGTRLGSCRVVRVHDIYMGAVPVLLETADGGRFQLDVLKRGPGVHGVAHAGQLSIYVSNHGHGWSPTNERQGQAALALARALRGSATALVPRGLLTLRQRLRRFPRGGFSIPLKDA